MHPYVPGLSPATELGAQVDYPTTVMGVFLIIICTRSY